MKTTLDTTHSGTRASVVPLGNRYYTLAIGAVETAMSVEVDCTAEGLGVVLGAILEQLDDETVAELVANELDYAMTLALGTALIAIAEARHAEDVARVTER